MNLKRTAAPKRQRSRKGEGALLREDILAATAQILQECGDASAVSIRKVAQRSGVSTAALYLHFPDRETLLSEVCASVFVHLERDLVEAAQGADRPREALRRQGIAYIHFALARPEQYRFILMGPKGQNDPPDPAQLATSGAFANLLDTIRRCQTAGDLPRGDPLPVALAFWAGAHGIASLMISASFMPWPDVETIGDYLFNSMMHGLCES